MLKVCSLVHLFFTTKFIAHLDLEMLEEFSEFIALADIFRSLNICLRDVFLPFSCLLHLHLKSVWWITRKTPHTHFCLMTCKSYSSRIINSLKCFPFFHIFSLGIFIFTNQVSRFVDVYLWVKFMLIQELLNWIQKEVRRKVFQSWINKSKQDLLCLNAHCSQQWFRSLLKIQFHFN